MNTAKRGLARIYFRKDSSVKIGFYSFKSVFLFLFLIVTFVLKCDQTFLSGANNKYNFSLSFRFKITYYSFPSIWGRQASTGACIDLWMHVGLAC